MLHDLYTYFAEDKLGWLLVWSHTDDSWAEEMDFVTVLKLPAIKVLINKTITKDL
jgi:hypothetical protein